MREIKFRAWDKDQKKMLYDDSLHDYFLSFSGSIGYINGCGNAVFNDDNGFINDQQELMQYTGHKDNNEKEIYEGDIVAVEEYGDPPKARLVEYDEEKCGFFPMIWEMRDAGNKKYEVIGNIHENPELLK